MTKRMELQPLTEMERRMLGALCALADEGREPIGLDAADWLEMDRGCAYAAIGRLQKKGWIAGEKIGPRRPLHILARPRRIPVPPPDAKPMKTFELRHPEDRPAKRPCLGCGNTFPSDGWGNRMCPKCKS